MPSGRPLQLVADNGLSQATAGWIHSFLFFPVMAVAFATPVIQRRARWQPTMVVAMVAVLTVAYLGLTAAPADALHAITLDWTVPECDQEPPRKNLSTDDPFSSCGRGWVPVLAPASLTLKLLDRFHDQQSRGENAATAR